MIERITLMKLTQEHATDEGREALLARVLEALASLPGLHDFHLGVPGDQASLKSWDLSAVMRADSLEDLEVALADLAYQACLEDIAPQVAVIKAWNFTV